MSKRYFLIICVLCLIVFNTVHGQTRSTVPKPAAFFGFEPGSDRNLFTYEQLIGYLNKLDEKTDRLKLLEIGRSPLDKPIYICFISHADNISNLERLKQINRILALEGEIADPERAVLITEGKVFVLSTMSMHSGEVAPSQSVPLIAYHLANTQAADTLSWLENVVLMIVPCHNPDGMDMVVEHYQKYKNTDLEGCSLPGIYHKYIGHDNNRDFITLSQSDTRAIARIYNQDWFPQVMVEKHQMGSTGPRYYVPPPHDPIAENIDAVIWNWIGVFGANMQTDMTSRGLQGIAQHYLFDDYWPGSTETCIWKNVIGFLTEGASAKYATPVYIEPTELAVYGKGLSEYKKSINMPLPWPGGCWRLSDLVRYEIESTMSIVKTASCYREKILEVRNDLCRSEIRKGQTEAPFYYVLPQKQHDRSEYVRLISLLMEQGIDVYTLTETFRNETYALEPEDVIIPLAQPFRAFIKEVMEKQEFPVRHYTPDGELIKPYDITSWSLPLHRGLTALEINERLTDLESLLSRLDGPFRPASIMPQAAAGFLFDARNNESVKAAFKAHALGFKVFRTGVPLEKNGHQLPRGSLYVQTLNNERNVNALLKSLLIMPESVTSADDLRPEAVHFPRIGLVETYFHDMDAGWTRFVFDEYGIPFTILRPADLRKANLIKTYDVIIFPDVSKSILMEGKMKSGDDYYFAAYPREYTKGMEKEGLQNIAGFIQEGGRIISWGMSTALFTDVLSIARSEKDIEEFRMPVTDISESLEKKGLYVPGSFLRVQLEQNHPLTAGMPSETGIFFRGRPVFSTQIPSMDMDRRVIAKFPEREIVLSGYAEQDQLLGNKPAMVWIKKGKGHLVLYGFRPQFRASTQVSYKLLFNAILLP